MRLGAVVMLAAALFGGPLARSSRSASVDTALCYFDTTGTAGNTGISPVGVTPPVPTPFDSLVGQPKRNTYTMRGPIYCTGSVHGENLNTGAGGRTDGVMTAVGQDPPDPLGSNPDDTFNACLVVTAPLQITVHLKGHRPWHGRVVMQTAMFDMALLGDLGGASLLGRAGFGADPERSQGECTSNSPYTEWGVTGEFALTDLSRSASLDNLSNHAKPKPNMITTPSLTGRGVHHQIPIAEYHYVGGGTVNGPDGMNPNVRVDTAPYRVLQGDTITFTNLDTHPHTVTSCSNADCDSHAPTVTGPGLPPIGGRLTSRCLAPGCADGRIDSSGTLDDVGGVFTVDTATLAPGTYSYFCEFHRWMRGAFEVDVLPVLP